MAESADVLALRSAAAAVVTEWGDGDGVDPDRMDDRVAALQAALRRYQNRPGERR